MDKYDNKCGSCYWLRSMYDDTVMFCGTINERGHCIYLKNCYYPDDTICSYYKDRDKYVPGTGCYITTIVSDILGYDDNCSILKILRDFRKNVMQKSSDYAQLLYEYDNVGPKIAKAIIEENDLELINGILDFYILPTITLIKNNNYYEAIDRYKLMTKSLKNYYGIECDSKIPKDYNYADGGHGYVRIKTNGGLYE